MNIASILFKNRTTYNPSDKNAAVTLSNNNLTASVTKTLCMCRASMFYKSYGKWYWEVSLIQATNLLTIGIAKSTANLSSFLGSDTSGWAIYTFGALTKIRNSQTNGGDTPSRAGYSAVIGTSIVTGDILGFALDLDNGFIYISKNGSWFNGLTSNAIPADPTSGSAGQGAIYHALSGSFCPAFGGHSSATDTTMTVKANFGQSSFIYPVPSGYNPGFYM